MPARAAATWSPTSPGNTPSRSSARCSGTPREDWHLFSDWADDIFKVFGWNVVNDEPDILRAWNALDAYVDDMVDQRRDALTDDLLSDMIRAEDDGDRLTHDELLHARRRRC